MPTPVDYTPRARMARIERDEILLSYLTGLGPVGTPVMCMAKWLRKDMQWDHQTYYISLRNLVRSGKIKCFHQGQYIVLKPLEVGRKVEAFPAEWLEAAE